MEWACLRRSWTFIRIHEFFAVFQYSVYGKQHLSVVVFNSLVGFLCTPRVCATGQLPKSTTGMFSLPMRCCTAQETGVVVNRQLALPSRQCSSTFLALHSDFILAKNQTLRVIEFPALQECLFYFFRPKVAHFSSNENPMRTLTLCHSNAACNQLTLLTSEKIQACAWRFKVVSCKRASLKFTRFSQKKKKVEYFSNRVVYPQLMTNSLACTFLLWNFSVWDLKKVIEKFRQAQRTFMRFSKLAHKLTVSNIYTWFRKWRFLDI